MWWGVGVESGEYDVELVKGREFWCGNWDGVASRRLRCGREEKGREV